MPDDRSKRGTPDTKRINVHEDYEVRYWCGELRVTREQLIAAVQAVGDSVAAVRRYLGR